MPMNPVAPFPAARPGASPALRAVQPYAGAAANGRPSGVVGREPSEEGRVSLSLAGLQQAKTTNKGKDSDIDDSGLPDTLKELLKMARKLKAQLQERSATLQQLMANGSLTAEERSLKAQQLQIEISTLNGALATVMAQFAKAMKDADLSHEQAAKVAKLLAA